MVLGLGVAHSVSKQVGVSLDDFAAAELALTLEVRLREIVSLASKLSKRARRQRLLCADIEDALRSVTGPVGPPEFWAEALSRSAADGRVRPLADLSGRSLPPVPKDVHLSVEWLAVNGCVVAGWDAGRGGLRDTDASDEGPRQGHSHSFCDNRVYVAPPSLLSEEQLALVHRVAAVLGHFRASVSWNRTVLSLCGREQFAFIRPFLAHFLVQHVPTRLERASSQELHLCLGVLEAISLAPKAELYLHQCLHTLFTLCLSPALGTGTRPGLVSVQRRAASLLVEVALRCRDSIPELFGEICTTHQKALQRSAHLQTVCGAIWGLSAVGPGCVERVLMPLVCGEFVPRTAGTVAESCGVTRVVGADQDLDAGEVDHASHKRQRLSVPAHVNSSADWRATTFVALHAAAHNLAKHATTSFDGVSLSTQHFTTSGESLRCAAVICEAAASSLGTVDPAATLSSLPVGGEVRPHDSSQWTGWGRLSMCL